MKTEHDGQDAGWLEQVPPWVVFPRMHPVEVAARQGAEEVWVDTVWRPFWASLDTAQRQAYFDHWRASDEWRDAIRSTFEPDPGFDERADAEESAAYLEQWRAARSAHTKKSGIGGLLGRLFRRR